DVTLTGVTVTDPLGGGTLASGVTLAVGPSGFADYAASHTLTQDEIEIRSAPRRVTKTATAASDQAGTEADSVDTPRGWRTGIAIDKTQVGYVDSNRDGLVDAGDVINYNVHVSNTGDVTLTGVTVTDPLGGGTLASGVTLAVGPSGFADYAASHTLTQDEI